MRRVWFVIETVMDKLIIIFFAIFLFFGLYTVYDSVMVYLDASDVSLQKYKPGHETVEEDSGKSILKDKMVGWVTVNDTTIDYPIMQGNTNQEFLNKDPFGDYSLSGSIFLDHRNSADFSDAYSLVYGHHLSGDVMFGILDNYLKEGYLENHGTGTLFVGEKEYDLRLFAVLDVLVSERIVFSPNNNNQELLDYIKKYAIFMNKGNFPENGEDVIGLSTCKSLNTADRTVVFGKIVER